LKTHLSYGNIHGSRVISIRDIIKISPLNKKSIEGYKIKKWGLEMGEQELGTDRQNLVTIT